jgi:hypothetical protein
MQIVTGGHLASDNVDDIYVSKASVVLVCHVGCSGSGGCLALMPAFVCSQ